MISRPPLLAVLLLAGVASVAQPQGRLLARTEGTTAKGPRNEDWVWQREK